MIIGRAAYITVGAEWRRLGVSLSQRTLIEVVLQDRSDRSITAKIAMKSAQAGGFQPLSALLTRQTNDPEA